MLGILTKKYLTVNVISERAVPPEGGTLGTNKSENKKKKHKEKDDHTPFYRPESGRMWRKYVALHCEALLLLGAHWIIYPLRDFFRLFLGRPDG